MEAEATIESVVNHSSLAWTWNIQDIHLNILASTDDNGVETEWQEFWDSLTSNIFEAGNGTPQHSRWKFSLKKLYFEEEPEDDIALGVHFLGLVQSDNGLSAKDQKLRCLVEGTTFGLNSTTNELKKVRAFETYHEFSASSPDVYVAVIWWSFVREPEHKKLFADNTIKIKCKLALIDDTVTKTVLDFGQLSLEETQTMENTYGTFYNNPDLSDFSIILSQDSAAPVQFFAHKLVLAAQSSVFRRMLQTPMMETLENKLIIQDIDLQTLELMLQFIYKGTIEIPEDALCIFRLLNAAKLYELKLLSKLIALKLQSLLTDKNVGELTVTAYEVARGHDDVISVLRDYCQRRQKILWKNPEYKKLFLQNPAAFMGE